MKSSGFSDVRFGNAPPHLSQNLTSATLPYFAGFTQQRPQPIGGLPRLGETGALPLDDGRQLLPPARGVGPFGGRRARRPPGSLRLRGAPAARALPDRPA